MSDDDLFWSPFATPEPEPASEQPHPTEPLDTSTYGPEWQGGHLQPQVSDPGARSRRWTALVVAATAFVFGGGGVAVGADLLNHDSSAPVTSSGLTVGSASSVALSNDPKSYAAIAAKVLPSVVNINVTSQSESDTGSGIVLRSDGYILTNNHVVAAASDGGQISVTFNDGSNSTAKVVGTDPLDDLAVIKVSKSGLTPATLGDSSDIQVGDPVLAVGSPLGLQGTVTEGIVSALNRPVQTEDDSQQQQQQDPFGFGFGENSTPQATTEPTVIDAIQTDAAINPGNSGGALVDSAGQVVGINSAIASLGSTDLSGQSGSIGVGFAIPINQAKVIASELIETGHATHPLLGVTLADATSADGADQALVRSVTAGGPAAKAGLKEGDVITAINGHPTAGADAVIAFVRSFQPGDDVTVTYVRSGSTKTATVTLSDSTTS
ncbi:MAG TPA: trypsin-like peptidase domain-containing protein [Mycobacteriales bacterium]|jgi:putative serine protease PepD|nr:trypsin-like peptidase domain-containing protein [Mycobacteriales bacterium]